MAEQDDTPIENCTRFLKFQCPKQWGNLLKDTLQENVRFCRICRKQVYLYKTDGEAKKDIGDFFAITGRTWTQNRINECLERGGREHLERLKEESNLLPA